MESPGAWGPLEHKVAEALKGTHELNSYETADRVLATVFADPALTAQFKKPMRLVLAEAIEKHRSLPKGWCGPSETLTIANFLRLGLP